MRHFTTNPATHIATTNLCENCHVTAGWTKYVVDHTQVTGACASCHNGTIATGQGLTHIKVQPTCADCHVVTAWTGVLMTSATHKDVIGTCASCHNGVIATGQGVAHIKTTTLCEGCHNTAAWTNVVMTSTTHQQVIPTTCVSCHTGAFQDGITLDGKGPSHISTTNSCENCHKTSGWAGVVMTASTHLQVIPKTCVSCHTGGVRDGIAINGKGPSHISTTTSCEACHNTSAWTGVVMSATTHLQVVGACATCHTGATQDGILIVGLAANHIPLVSPACNNCHNTTAWTGVVMRGSATLHGYVSPNCFTCHSAANASHYGVTGQHSAHPKGAPPASCDGSGCHSGGFSNFGGT